MTHYTKAGTVICWVCDETGKRRALLESVAAAKRMCANNPGWTWHRA